jgi:hypothetical protein
MEDEKYKETIKKRLKTMFEEGELVRAILDMALVTDKLYHIHLS